ncbi:MAG: 2-oxoacid:acceptor oxidoreductase subunit alpha [Bacteroidales bacterium]|nr:2-oxoacid:acceptor oxidoreductase subunit alpha [Bacteroidales bacterium]
MTEKKSKVIELEEVVVKFAGDSGDGMQLAGSLFADNTATVGNDFATFPDYPAEIRAPHNTISGVSGFQIHFGSKLVISSGDIADVLVAMNPASLKANLNNVKYGGTIVVDADTFVGDGITKAGYTNSPLDDGSLKDYHLIAAPITSLTREAQKELGCDNKTADKCRNVFALGIIYYLFNRELESTFKYFETKFAKNQTIVEANKKVLAAGYNYAENVDANKTTFIVDKYPLKKGKYRYITGNSATAWGMIAAAEKAGLELYLGSYPITPATEILIELENRRDLGVKAYQAEDEIAGICSAIGAAFAGALAITTTSGPGLSLKSEAIGLAVMTELPIVIVDVQRGGPSTGLPTKTEQSDLLQALYGRNGEGQVVVIAASSPGNCFNFAFEAAKIALEHMTPVILLTDGYIANGSEVIPVPKLADLPKITPRLAKANDPNYAPYRRDEKTLARQWAIPGTEGLRHRIGGLEKENITGNVSHNPENHQLMATLRDEKVQRVADVIGDQKIIGDQEGDLLIVGWGGTYGALKNSLDSVKKKYPAKKIGLAHFNYINPLPKNTEDVFKKFKKIVVCELNFGQFAKYLKINLPQFKYEQYNKLKGLPFFVSELVDAYSKLLEE